MENRETEVRAFIVENFLYGEDSAELKPTDSFLEAGIIDSTGVLELVSFVEKKYGIKIRDEEIVPENLDSIRQLANFITSKSASVAK